jgi:hypothetical protein
MEKFKVTTFLGTLFIVLAIIGWISTILCATREEPELEVIFLLYSIMVTLIAIKFGTLCFDAKDSFQKPCEKCGEQINYYWFFGFYIGRHICSKDTHK